MIRTLGTEFGHFFLLEQDGEVTLIDAGLSGYRDTLEPALAEMGRSIDDVKAIVLTHADPDHVGFAGELQASHGIPVYVHRADSERTRQGKFKQAEGSPLAMLAHAQARPQPPRAAPHDRQRRSQAVQGPEGHPFRRRRRARRARTTASHSHPRAYRGPLRPLRPIRGRPVRRRRHQQHRHRHRTARRAPRASDRHHLHRPGLRIAVQDRGSGGCAPCTSATATHPRKEPARSSPRPAPIADQTVEYRTHRLQLPARVSAGSLGRGLRGGSQRVFDPGVHRFAFGLGSTKDSRMEVR